MKRRARAVRATSADLAWSMARGQPFFRNEGRGELRSGGGGRRRGASAFDFSSSVRVRRDAGRRATARRWTARRARHDARGGRDAQHARAWARPTAMWWHASGSDDEFDEGDDRRARGPSAVPSGRVASPARRPAARAAEHDDRRPPRDEWIMEAAERDGRRRAARASPSASSRLGERRRGRSGTGRRSRSARCSARRSDEAWWCRAAGGRAGATRLAPLVSADARAVRRGRAAARAAADAGGAWTGRRRARADAIAALNVSGVRGRAAPAIAPARRARRRRLRAAKGAAGRRSLRRRRAARAHVLEPRLPPPGFRRRAPLARPLSQSATAATPPRRASSSRATRAACCTPHGVVRAPGPERDRATIKKCPATIARDTCARVETLPSRARATAFDARAPSPPPPPPVSRPLLSLSQVRGRRRGDAEPARARARAPRDRGRLRRDLWPRARTSAQLAVASNEIRVSVPDRPGLLSEITASSLSDAQPEHRRREHPG